MFTLYHNFDKINNKERVILRLSLITRSFLIDFPATEKSGETRADGQKGRGSECHPRQKFCPSALPAEGGLGVGKRFRNSCVSRKAKQKNFRFLN